MILSFVDDYFQILNYTHIHTYTNIFYTHIDIYTQIYTCIHTFTHIYTYIHRYTRIYTHIHIYTHIYTHLHTHIYTHLHTHTYTHFYAHIDTHIHKYTRIYAHMRRCCCVGRLLLGGRGPKTTGGARVLVLRNCKDKRKYYMDTGSLFLFVPCCCCCCCCGFFLCVCRLRLGTLCWRLEKCFCIHAACRMAYTGWLENLSIVTPRVAWGHTRCAQETRWRQ